MQSSFTFVNRPTSSDIFFGHLRKIVGGVQKLLDDASQFGIFRNPKGFYMNFFGDFCESLEKFGPQ